MKNLKYLVIATLLITFSSCEDYFDVESDSSYDDTYVFSSPELTESYIYGIYQHLGENNAYRNRADRYFGGNTDIERYKTSNTTTAVNSGGTSLNQYNVTQDNTADNLDVIWSKAYSSIERANTAIHNIKQFGSPAANNKMGALYAEALAMRAYLYYDLVRWWGDVPARFEPTSANNIYLPKTDRNIILAQIINDLKEAENYVDWAGKGNAPSSVQRPSREAIKAFRARVSLFAAGYAQYPLSKQGEISAQGGEIKEVLDNCVVARAVSETRKEELYREAQRACLDVIEEKRATLPMEFEDVFIAISRNETNPANTESLWELNYRNHIVQYWGLIHTTIDAFAGAGTNQGFYAIPTLFFDYETSDTRRDVTVCPFVWTNDAPVVCKVNQMSFGKLRPEWLSGQLLSSGDTFGHNIVIRKSDVLLMYAETTIVIGNVSGGISGVEAFNVVRSRANASTKTSITMDDIYQERALEFAGERLRKTDLIRWGLLKKKIDEAKEKLLALKGIDGIRQAPYENVPSKIYTKLNSSKFMSVNTAAFPAEGNIAKLEFYGLNIGEVDDKTAEGWEDNTKGFWDDNNKAIGSEWMDGLYINNPDGRSLLPVPKVIIDSSHGMLSNEYGY